MRQPGESNAINRVLKARGLPSLESPGVVEALAFLVEDHTHFMELLRACDPQLRRDMYESMRPHLRFTARPLDHYLSMAQDHAAAAELPVMDEQGFLHPYNTPFLSSVVVPDVQLWAKCGECGKDAVFLGTSKADCVFVLRAAGWGWDEFDVSNTICDTCLGKVPDAVDAQAS